MSHRFVCIRVGPLPADAAERAAAEAYAAGALGLEELGEPERRSGSRGVTLLLYAPAAAAGAVRAAVSALGVGPVAAPEPVPEVDWSERWRAGLSAVEVSPRLRVRPSFVSDAPAPGQAEVVVDPRQAFGTGGHASTRLALELLDGMEAGLLAGARVLDVGTGSGVLALAALRLGASAAVGFDLDPAAAREARDNARRNGLADRLRVLAGPIEALAGPPFDVALANLLRTELLPLVPAIAERVRPGGAVIVSGLLESERPQVAAALAAAGLERVAERGAEDPPGQRWVALLTRRRGRRASARADAGACR